MKVSSGNPSGLGLRISASVLFKIDTSAESNRVRMFADWWQNQSKGAKNLPEKSGGGFGLFGDFPTHPAGLRTRDVQQVAKPRICLRFCMGLMHGTNE